MNATRTRAACFDSVKADMRARPLVRHTYRAWHIMDSTECAAIDVADATTLAEALGKVPLFHKRHFVIHETDTITGKTVAHFYQVKETKKWLKCPDTGVTRNVGVPYSVKLFAMAMDAFDPVEPWSWSPGADVVGADRNEVRL
ncbi:hypothetical protein [Novosphingobium sp. EMRT-2]|uniref:hypothetical protein n=1 Tax=Novosphingobium sp. EMRT-2 TaxID=2571749 RepID=UPI0010BD5E51|nr:hypothetical protein [Novosphingobium sp. EMRT-2]QCI93358.1 hypothetical protein FA702_07195 [Novosphingobium sp. EMRT-2]